MKKMLSRLAAIFVLAFTMFNIAGCSSDSSNNNTLMLAMIMANQNKPVPVEKISIANLASELSLNNEYTVQPTFVPENTTEREFKITANSESVKINGNKITLVGTGDFTITVTSTANSKVTDSKTVKSKGVGLEKIAFANESETAFIGKTTDSAFSPVFTPADSSYKTLKWTSSDETIAKVDANTGKITGIKEGTVKITATSVDVPSISASFTLDVVPYVAISEYIIDEFDTSKGFISPTEAEGGKLNKANVTGYSGDGYLDNPPFVLYSVNSPIKQKVKVNIRYAHWGWTDQIKAAYLVINGKSYLNPEEILYGNHTGKNLADSNVITVTLNKGENNIRLLPVEKGTTLQKYDEAKGYGVKYPNGEADEEKAKTDTNVAGLYKSDGMIPNLDYIKFYGGGLSKGSNSLTFSSVAISSENTKFGTVKADPDQSLFAKGSEITVTAEPKAGYKFDSWIGSKETTATIKVKVENDMTLTAHFIPISYSNEQNAGLEGYAAISDDSGTKYTVFGGFGGETIILSSLADIEANKAKLSGNDSYIIKVTARITTPTNASTSFDIGSNKTLIGEPGKDYGFKNINPKVSGENVIIKNLHFGDVIGDDLWKGTGNDALSIKGGKHIWIDHCEFSSSIDPKNNDGTPLSFADYQKAGGVVDLEGESTTPETKWKKDFYDGLLDISEQSRFISVSNCYFHDHWKACLCGGSNDKQEQQAQGSQVRLTMYNNYFNNIHARQPLFRFGKAHIYSSYLYGADDASGIEVRAKSEVYVDNVYFEHFKKSVGCWNSSSGDIGAGAWKVVDCDGIAADTSSNSTNYVPPYTWTKTSAADSKANLPKTAGNK